MEYLFQFQVVAKDVISENEIIIDFKGMRFSLHLHEIYSISSSKKARFIISGDSRENARENIISNLYDLNQRLMFLACQRIVIFPYPELVLEAQKGVDVRNVLIWCFNLSGENYLDRWNFDFKYDFFNTPIDERHMSAMKLFNDALQADLPQDQFKSLYRTIEKLAGSEIVQSNCSKCGQTLNPRTTNSAIDDFLSRANQNRMFVNEEIPKARELRGLRGKHSHVGGNRNPTPNAKLGQNSKQRDLVEIVRILSGLIRFYFAAKFGFSYGGEVIGKSSIPVKGFEAKFRTNHPAEIFAIEDIPPIDEYLSRSAKTRWIFDK